MVIMIMPLNESDDLKGSRAHTYNALLPFQDDNVYDGDGENYYYGDGENDYGDDENDNDIIIK